MLTRRKNEAYRTNIRFACHGVSVLYISAEKKKKYADIQAFRRRLLGDPLPLSWWDCRNDT